MRNKFLLFILFILGVICANAQTDSTHTQLDSIKLKRWSFSIGMLRGFHQLCPSTQVHYDEVKNHIRMALVSEATLQFHSNRNWSVSLGGRFGKRTTYSVFYKDNTPLTLVSDQLVMEIPLMVGYTWENARQKEIITLEAGALVGSAISMFYSTVYDGVVPVQAPSEINYYSTMVRISKSIPLTPLTKIKVLIEYDASAKMDHTVQIGYYTDQIHVDDEVNTQYRTLYLGVAFVF